jgi:hypothetical protein
MITSGMKPTGGGELTSCKRAPGRDDKTVDEGLQRESSEVQTCNLQALCRLDAPMTADDPGKTRDETKLLSLQIAVPGLSS